MIWHSHESQEVLKELQADPAVGLSSATAEARLLEYGENRLQDQKQLTFIQRFILQMKDTMVIILLMS
jgi:Ca2+-transporting ATPase